MTVNYCKNDVTKRVESNTNIPLTKTIFFGTVRIEHEEWKSETTRPYLHAGSVEGEYLINDFKIQMSFRERNRPPQAQAQGTPLDGVRPGNDAIVPYVRMEVQHLVSKKLKPKIGGELVIGVLVGQVLKADIGMPRPRDVGIPFQAWPHPVADRLTLVFDLSGLQTQRQKVGLAHLGKTRLRQSQSYDSYHPKNQG